LLHNLPALAWIVTQERVDAPYCNNEDGTGVTGLELAQEAVKTLDLIQLEQFKAWFRGYCGAA
jgi:hypothetical protein